MSGERLKPDSCRFDLLHQDEGEFERRCESVQAYPAVLMIIIKLDRAGSLYLQSVSPPCPHSSVSIITLFVLDSECNFVGLMVFY